MKSFLALTIALLCTLACHADQVITRNADIIDCKVVAINDNVVIYRNNGENFNREIPRNEVFKIKYDNGDEELITTHQAAVQTVAQPAAQALTQYTSQGGTSVNDLVSTEPQWDLLPPASKPYFIGDWYSENGVEGIVIWTTPDGRHGRLLHPKKFGYKLNNQPKALFTGDLKLPIGMNDRTNGYANWQALKHFMVANPQLTPDMFPMYTQLASLGDGWYLPSIGELEYLDKLRKTKVEYQGIHSNFNGKTVKWSKILDHVSKQHDGSKHDDYGRTSSSEVYSRGGASATSLLFYGDPAEPGYCLLKLLAEEKETIKPVVRHKGCYPYYALHLF